MRGDKGPKDYRTPRLLGPEVGGSNMSHPRLFVAGASGFLGMSLLNAAKKDGTPVLALVRSASKAREVEAAGAEALVGDILRPETYLEGLRGCETVVHLAQDGSGPLEEMRRVRVEGGLRLVEASERTRVPRLLIGSGYWVYGSTPGSITEENEPRPVHLSAVNHATEEVGRRAVREGRIQELVVARPGMVYGPGSWLAGWAQELLEGTFRFVDDGSNFMSPIHWEDAGTALLRLAKDAPPASTYLVVDDEPVTVKEFATVLSGLLHSPPPQGIPMAKAREEWGAELAELNAANRSASNAALRALGWRPRFPSFREGLPEIVKALQVPH